MLLLDFVMIVWVTTTPRPLQCFFVFGGGFFWVIPFTAQDFGEPRPLISNNQDLIFCPTPVVQRKLTLRLWLVFGLFLLQHALIWLIMFHLPLPFKVFFLSDFVRFMKLKQFSPVFLKLLSPNWFLHLVTYSLQIFLPIILKYLLLLLI